MASFASMAGHVDEGVAMEAVSHWQPHVVALDDDPAVRELLTEYLSETTCA